MVPTPFHILLESPELASLTQALGAFCRYRTALGPRLSELLVLIIAAHWEAEYEFAVHAPEARKAKPVHDALYGPITTACPASILRRQSNATLYLDAESSALLES